MGGQEIGEMELRTGELARGAIPGFLELVLESGTPIG